MIAAWIQAAADPSATGLLIWLFTRLAENRSAISIDLSIQKAEFSTLVLFWFTWDAC